MPFDVDKFKGQPETFLAEHERATREMRESGLRFARFIDAETSSVLYLLRIGGVLMNLDEIEGLLFVRSMAVPFKASRYGGHAAAEVRIESIEVPADLLSRKTEIVELLARGLETYRLWFATAFWTEEP